MGDGSIRILATFVPVEGCEDQVREVLRTVAAATREEPGNDTYELLSSAAHGRTRFHLLERYVDADAVDAHRASEHYRAYRAAITDLLAEPIDVAVLDEVDAPADPTR